MGLRVLEFYQLPQGRPIKVDFMISLGMDSQVLDISLVVQLMVIFGDPQSDMVHGAQSGSNSGRRSSHGRGLFAASGLGEFTPPPPIVLATGPSSVPPSLAVGPGQSTTSPPIVAGPSSCAPPAFLAGASTVPEAEDDVSLQEGGGSFYDTTLWEVWINGVKIEPTQASQFITRIIQAHFLGPIHTFS
ncbi:hypothetical protein Taro_012102, partial [Colocasia esculenta]|nr:hypothetical protein [Colocasia esculenta]